MADYLYYKVWDYFVLHYKMFVNFLQYIYLQYVLKLVYVQTNITTHLLHCFGFVRFSVK